MRAVFLILIIAVVALIAAVLTGMVNLRQTEPAVAPGITASDGKIITRPGQAPAFDVETGQVVDTLAGHAEGVNACVISPDGRHAVSASADHTLKIWGLTLGRTVRLGHAGEVNGCALTPDGARVVSASARASTSTTIKCISRKRRPRASAATRSCCAPRSARSRASL